ncbi:TPA: hypothetical protein ACIU9R_004333 [Salmonella enterica subsp. enterica serovar Birkenhead]|uniref:hypothetical protein n=1 Tax=Salmonella enterica TaxID=28901 RepID=UPI0012A92F90|nr:hypothetical protein [Salmonella enterica]QGK33154.1 hypothetical protein GJE06_23215 [Salmonella enterica subsp. enterica serovar Birkenhead]
MSGRDSPRVVVYGDEWAVTAAVCSLVSQRWPRAVVERASGLSALVQTLRRHGTAGVLLCLRPHEHIPVLDALTPLLRGRVVRVVSPVVWYSDRMVLGWLGYRPAVTSEKRHLHRIVYRVRPRIMCFCASCYLCVLEDGRIRLSREGEMIVEYARSDAAYLLDDLPDVEPSGYSLPGGH